MHRAHIFVAASGALALLLSAASRPARACEDGVPEIGYLGISDLSCNCSTNFSLSSRDGRRLLVRQWIFRSEPVVRGVESNGPSAGKLREDDVITAVDGLLITTQEGGQRFSRLIPGQKVTLTIRREGREMPVPIVVGSICPEELGGPFSVRMLVAPRAEETPGPPPMPSVEPVPPTPAMPPMPRVFMKWPASEFPGRAPEAPRAGPDALPRGWIGIGLNCQECGSETSDENRTPVWTFGTLPTVSYVDPEGPAARAGMRRGDQLTHVDGVSLLTENGGRRFGAIHPGQTVKWTLVRDGSTLSLPVTAVARPGERRQALDAVREQLRALREMRGAEREDTRVQRTREQVSLEEALRSLERSRGDMVRTGQSRRLRYAGSVAGSDVEVRGLGNVVVDDTGDEIVITTPDATIRVRPSAKGTSAPAPRATPKPGK
jgi:hypothetical protein